MAYAIIVKTKFLQHFFNRIGFRRFKTSFIKIQLIKNRRGLWLQRVERFFKRRMLKKRKNKKKRAKAKARFKSKKRRFRRPQAKRLYRKIMVKKRKRVKKLRVTKPLPLVLIKKIREQFTRKKYGRRNRYLKVASSRIKTLRKHYLGVLTKRKNKPKILYRYVCFLCREVVGLLRCMLFVGVSILS